MDDEQTGPITFSTSSNENTNIMDQVLEKNEEEALRAQLHVEIEERSKLCANKKFACNLPRLPGYQHCNQHILQEPSAPYKRCRYIFGTRRCHEPAPITNYRRDSGLCFEHARASILSRSRAMTRAAPKPSAEVMLLSLSHYVNAERIRTQSCASQISVVSEPSDRPDSPVPADPFKNINATDVNANIGSRILDYWSSSSDSEPIRGGGADEDSSGAEDTQADTQPLRYAGIYTCEEAIGEAGVNLRRLQALYIQQLRDLAVRLRDGRRNYLSDLKAERDSHCSIHSQEAKTAEEIRDRKILKSITSFRKKHGIDAVFCKKLHDKRAKITNGITRNIAPPGSRCIFTEGGVKCSRISMPSARHCQRHILNDRHQVLFRACGANRAGLICNEPILAIQPTDTCVLHQELLPYQTFVLKKNESDSEEMSDNESKVNTKIKTEDPA